MSEMLLDFMSELPLTCAFYTIAASAQAHTLANTGTFDFSLSLGFSVSPDKQKDSDSISPPGRPHLCA